jgi:replicative DNA helicase
MPADLDAERTVLGAAILSATALAEMRTLIDGADFYKPPTKPSGRPPVRSPTPA